MTGKCGTNLDHAVLAVGYGTDAGQVRGSETPESDAPGRDVHSRSARMDGRRT